jgi:glutamine transport system permease protein
MLFSGLKVTLLISILGILIGFAIGAIAGFGLQAKNKIVKTIAGVYIWIIRGTPLIVQALYVYFVIPEILRTDLEPITCGVIVISLNSGAFIAEIVRGALEGIDIGQKEAGVSLGLTNTQTLIHVIVPPAFRSMLPALFNQFIISVKDTSLLSVITAKEITHNISIYASRSFKTIEAYTTGALFYLALISLMIIIQKQVERKVNKR